jgi:hypothetical protein
VILHEAGNFGVLDAVRAAVRESDAAQQEARRVENIDWPVEHLAAIVEECGRAADLEFVGSGGGQHPRRPDLDPLRAAGLAILRAEVVAAISHRSQHHLRVPLRSNRGVIALNRHCAAERSPPHAEAIADRPHVPVQRVIGSDRFRVEVFRVDEVGVLRTEVKRAGQDLRGRHDVVELRERVDRLLLRSIERKRERAFLVLHQGVLRGIQKIQAVFDQWAAQQTPRSVVENAAHVPTAPAEARKRIVDLAVPFVSAAPRLDGDYVRREMAVLGEKRRAQNFQCVDAVDWHGRSEAPGRGVCHIGRIDHHGAAVLAGAGDLHLSVRRFHDARHQRQGLADCRGTVRKILHVIGVELLRFRGNTLLDSSDGIVDFHAVADDQRLEGEIDFGGRSGLEFKCAAGQIMESFFCHTQDTRAASEFFELDKAGDVRRGRRMISPDRNLRARYRVARRILNPNLEFRGSTGLRTKGRSCGQRDNGPQDQLEFNDPRWQRS